jgi:hypothetical protein
MLNVAVIVGSILCVVRLTVSSSGQPGSGFSMWISNSGGDRSKSKMMSRLKTI